MEPLAHIQGSPSSTLTPLFLVHAVSGFSLPYFALPPLSHNNERPVYAISSPFFSQENYRLPRTLAQVAEEYVTMIRREVQPRGPYLLGGWSMGGMVAVKMARILREQGETVLHVVMIDSINPETTPRFFATGEHEFMTTLLYNEVTKRLGMPPLPLCSDTNEDYDSDSDRSIVTDDEDAEDPCDISLLLAKVRRHIANGLQMIAGDDPSPRPPKRGSNFFSVTLFKCTSRAASRVAPPGSVSRERLAYARRMFHDDAMGWEKEDFERFRVINISSNHETVFDRQHVANLTEQLRGVLDELEM